MDPKTWIEIEKQMKKEVKNKQREIIMPHLYNRSNGENLKGWHGTIKHILAIKAFECSKMDMDEQT